jgi:hypothetical protein
MRPISNATQAFLIATTAVISACRTAAPTVSAAASPPATSVERAARTSPDRLGYAEIKSAQVANAHEAVSRLRPQFLRRHWPTMANTGEGQPVIYLDGVRQGGADMLRSIPANAVHEIRYLNSAAANAEFGRWHPGGVISVRTKPE